ncbi:hypothetical protein LNKW23_23800 [Paralimibaculum aggregatum]|uniref:Uncharacterized protein n=1 Tax=Paralimibaculum aggregatum TaxID=3036245 RepID=A0ABQ6LN79_9RHOB|nr:hypothetical protein [Limibaculum sp. NKW23]GMG83167.1 hypothetical protein LNKW23_23800 [Limibaculum sp. NKW23]
MATAHRTPGIGAVRTTAGGRAICKTGMVRPPEPERLRRIAQELAPVIVAPEPPG